MSLHACLAFSCLIDKYTVLTIYLPVVSRCLHAFQWQLYTMNPLFNSWFIYRLQCSLKLPSSHSHSSRFLGEVAIYWKCNFSKRAKASSMSSNFPVLRCYHQFIMSPAFNFFSCRLLNFLVAGFLEHFLNESIVFFAFHLWTTWHSPQIRTKGKYGSNKCKLKTLLKRKVQMNKKTSKNTGKTILTRFVWQLWIQRPISMDEKEHFLTELN